MEKLLAGLLAAMQEAVIAAREGRVCIWNAPAEACFPGIREGMELDSLLSGDGIHGAGDGAVRFSSWEGYTLCTVPVSRDRSAVLYSAGSEMREALNSMSLAMERAEAVQQPDPKQERYNALLHKGFYRLLRVADNLSLLAEAELALQIAEFDLAACLRELNLTAEIYTRRGIRYDGPETLDFAGDRELLQRLYLNLLSNVLKYVPDGEICLKLRKKGGRVILSVTDRGPGMAREQMRTALAGEGGKTEHSPAEQGAGMGLAVVRKIAFAHGGTVLMESKPGKGTAVTVSLPLREMPAQLRSQALPYAARSIDPVLEELSDVLDWKAYRYLHGD